MTMISEPDMPAIEIGEQEHVGVEKTGKGKLLGVVVAGASLITLVNIAAAVYLSRGINDLRILEARLEQLGAFEQRMGSRLDTVNNGFQSRFEKLDSQLQAGFGEINRGIARLEQNPPVAGDDSVAGAPEPSMATTGGVEPPSAVADAEDATEPSVVEAPSPPRKRVASAAPPAPNSSYQRIQQADGKVYYRRIN